jgi:dipeptidyl aminopeptidase/acylaminoacyl peptidase
MPWDGTELWVSDISAKGGVLRIRAIAGGEKESIYQPSWSPGGVLSFVSDRSGWWNLYRWQDGSVNAIHPMEAEFGLPQWVFCGTTYGFASDEQIIIAYKQKDQSFLASCHLNSGKFEPIEAPFTDIWGLKADPDRVFFLAGSPTQPMSIVQLDLRTGTFETIRKSTDVDIDPGYLSFPQSIEFPTENNQTAYAYYYPPQNKDFTAVPGKKPPLLVMSHGGPTSSTSTILDLEVQYWTSRGIAVVDVNYSGSTGYGRAYRERLNGQWGVVDMQDCANAARYLVLGGVDPNRLAITGGAQAVHNFMRVDLPGYFQRWGKPLRHRRPRDIRS